jgi:hypothetical protein
MALAMYHQVLNMARRLERAEQLKLLQALLGEIGSGVGADAAKKRSILELKGLGREVWQGVDVEKYIQEERASWDG